MLPKQFPLQFSSLQLLTNSCKGTWPERSKTLRTRAGSMPIRSPPRNRSKNTASRSSHSTFHKQKHEDLARGVVGRFCLQHLCRDIDTFLGILLWLKPQHDFAQKIQSTSLTNRSKSLKNTLKNTKRSNTLKHTLRNTWRTEPHRIPRDLEPTLPGATHAQKHLPHWTP